MKAAGKISLVQESSLPRTFTLVAWLLKDAHPSARAPNTLVLSLARRLVSACLFWLIIYWQSLVFLCRINCAFFCKNCRQSLRFYMLWQLCSNLWWKTCLDSLQVNHNAQCCQCSRSKYVLFFPGGLSKVIDTIESNTDSASLQTSKHLAATQISSQIVPWKEQSTMILQWPQANALSLARSTTNGPSSELSLVSD